MSTKPKRIMTEEQRVALRDYRDYCLSRGTRGWKAALYDDWFSGNYRWPKQEYNHILQGIRHNFSPTWLDTLSPTMLEEPNVMVSTPLVLECALRGEQVYRAVCTISMRANDKWVEMEIKSTGSPVSLKGAAQVELKQVEAILTSLNLRPGLLYRGSRVAEDAA